ncbi:hypothetical protein GBAR_LOCUS3508 [Geodia barretti]|uniref:Uncharacterized protein n=1 Tax=Geodia barretti TaxID=519541 RepID=A0AA35R3L6_GEOBA|nr:hypothetical protein GBAR_LOCUS3508 [Geodia barretti]
MFGVCHSPATETWQRELSRYCGGLARRLVFSSVQRLTVCFLALSSAGPSMIAILYSLTQMKEECDSQTPHSGVLLKIAAGRLDYECLTALSDEGDETQ